MCWKDRQSATYRFTPEKLLESGNFLLFHIKVSCLCSDLIITSPDSTLLSDFAAARYYWVLFSVSRLAVHHRAFFTQSLQQSSLSPDLLPLAVNSPCSSIAETISAPSCPDLLSVFCPWSDWLLQHFYPSTTEYLSLQQIMKRLPNPKPQRKEAHSYWIW